MMSFHESHIVWDDGQRLLQQLDQVTLDNDRSILLFLAAVNASTFEVSDPTCTFTGEQTLKLRGISSLYPDWTVAALEVSIAMRGSLSLHPPTTADQFVSFYHPLKTNYVVNGTLSAMVYKSMHAYIGRVVEGFPALYVHTRQGSNTYIHNLETRMASVVPYNNQYKVHLSCTPARWTTLLRRMCIWCSASPVFRSDVQGLKFMLVSISGNKVHEHRLDAVRWAAFDGGTTGDVAIYAKNVHSCRNIIESLSNLFTAQEHVQMQSGIHLTSNLLVHGSTLIQYAIGGDRLAKADCRTEIIGDRPVVKVPSIQGVKMPYEIPGMTHCKYRHRAASMFTAEDTSTARTYYGVSARQPFDTVETIEGVVCVDERCFTSIDGLPADHEEL